MNTEQRIELYLEALKVLTQEDDKAAREEIRRRLVTLLKAI